MKRVVAYQARRNIARGKTNIDKHRGSERKREKNTKAAKKEDSRKAEIQETEIRREVEKDRERYTIIVCGEQKNESPSNSLAGGAPPTDLDKGYTP